MAGPPEQPITRDDAAWLKLKLWLSVQIRAAERQLERWPAPPQEYDVLRGRIAAYRDLIRIVEPERAPEQTDREGRDYLGAGESFDYS